MENSPVLAIAVPGSAERQYGSNLREDGTFSYKHTVRKTNGRKATPKAPATNPEDVAIAALVAPVTAPQMIREMETSIRGFPAVEDARRNHRVYPQALGEMKKEPFATMRRDGSVAVRGKAAVAIREHAKLAGVSPQATLRVILAHWILKQKAESEG